MDRILDPAGSSRGELTTRPTRPLWQPSYQHSNTAPASLVRSLWTSTHRRLTVSLVSEILSAMFGSLPTSIRTGTPGRSSFAEVATTGRLGRSGTFRMIPLSSRTTSISS